MCAFRDECPFYSEDFYYCDALCRPWHDPDFLRGIGAVYEE